MIGINFVQWLLICPPTRSWAKSIFPDLSPEDAEIKLWEAVIKACRLDTPDPKDFRSDYLNKFEIRARKLTDRQYQTLKFTGPGTDLMVGLPAGHIWIGGWNKSPQGVQFCANIPTEEIFTLPHREKTEGIVRATRPLSYQGNLIEDFQLTFSKGEVVDYSADQGIEILKGLLETDFNARFLGEIALVPHKSPISQQNLVFLNTLYDENASHHLALGSAYQISLKGGAEMPDQEFAEKGGNKSLIHEDFMFGSEDMDVDGLLADGTSEPVMRAGEWAFEV